MPLSRLAFTNPQTVGKKNLYSIEEGDDEGSLNSSGEDDVLSLLSKSGRQSTSLSATKPSDSSLSWLPLRVAATISWYVGYEIPLLQNPLCSSDVVDVKEVVVHVDAAMIIWYGV